MRPDYGARRDYRKIDVYVRVGAALRYLGATTRARDCTQARLDFAELYPQHAFADLSARYATEKGRA